VVIPRNVCGAVRDAADRVIRRERVIIDAAKRPGFDIDALRAAQRESAALEP
jgi:hypothetical protein